jgi:formylglycine-generating enzyme required for sulfatase activity
MVVGAEPLKDLLQSLRQQHGAWLTPQELADILWLALRLPPGEVARTEPPGEPEPEPGPGGRGIHVPDTETKQRSNPAERSVDDPLRHTLPSFFPPQPPQPPGLEPRAGLLPDQVLPNDADLRAVSTLRLQDVSLISAPRPLQAALQPLAAIAPATWQPHLRQQLDEAATVDAYARTQRLWPVYIPPREPRLSLVLLVDVGLSMQVWHRLAEELQGLLMRAALFRDVRTVALDPERPTAVLAALAVAAEDQAVLLLSDCSGRHWWDRSGLQPLLKTLTARCPVAILQVLPDWMWRRTALGIGRIVAVRNRQAFAANRFYQRLPLHSSDPTPPQGNGHLVLPLLGLSRESLADWSTLVLGRVGHSVPAACLPVVWPEIRISSPPADVSDSPEQQAQRRLAKYLQRCSGSAERLLRVMAASPVLTLPVMRLLQATMGHEGGPLAMAELLLSGMLKRQDDGASQRPALVTRRAADRIQFAFEPPQLRALLLNTLPGPETAQVVQMVSELIEHRWDQCDGVPPFHAYLLNPKLLSDDHPLAGMQAFATVTAQIIERLPGFEEMARSLRQSAGEEEADPFPPGRFMFGEIETFSAVLQRLPAAAPDAFTTAHIEDIPLSDGSLLEVLSAEEGVDLKLLPIPRGSFLMGSPPDEEGRYDDEGPQHEVEIQEFFLAQTPITQAQWRAVAQWQRQEHEEAELWPEMMDPDPVARLSDAERFIGPQRPVVNVSWNDAMAFCERLRLRTGKNYTLPSEAQWEYACRSGTTTPFHFGKTISSELANYNGTETYGDGPKGEYREQTTDVGMFPANAWGLHDMHGNVWEWCADHWHANYEGAPDDGRPWLDENVSEETSRLLRGGSWYGPPRFCRSAYRSFHHPDSRGYSLGFRVCCLPQDLILYPSTL